jgi:arsenate reductase-like glutaredoxin family protein
MIITNKDPNDKSHLQERLNLEKIKVQNSPVFWINEYIRSHIPSANDVTDLVRYSKNVTEQLESVYQDIDPLLEKTPSIADLYSYIKSLEDQVEDLYREKEQAIQSFEGVNSIEELVSLAKGMEDQLKSMYNELENNYNNNGQV